MTTGIHTQSEVALFAHQMIPHHQNAVNMAKTLLYSGMIPCDDLTDEDPLCIMNVISREIINNQNLVRFFYVRYDALRVPHRHQKRKPNTHILHLTFSVETANSTNVWRLGDARSETKRQLQCPAECWLFIEMMIRYHAGCVVCLLALPFFVVVVGAMIAVDGLHDHNLLVPRCG
jgi:hypothetical protein